MAVPDGENTSVEQGKRTRNTAIWVVVGVLGLGLLACPLCAGIVYFLAVLPTVRHASEQAFKDTAMVQVKVLTTACQAYAVDHAGQYPDNLEQLIVKDGAGRGPYLQNRDALLDPWGKQYVYEKSGKRNKELVPDISTTTPDGTVIANWPKDR